MTRRCLYLYYQMLRNLHCIAPRDMYLDYYHHLHYVVGGGFLPFKIMYKYCDLLRCMNLADGVDVINACYNTVPVVYLGGIKNEL